MMVEGCRMVLAGCNYPQHRLLTMASKLGRQRIRHDVDPGCNQGLRGVILKLFRSRLVIRGENGRASRALAGLGFHCRKCQAESAKLQ